MAKAKATLTDPKEIQAEVLNLKARLFEEKFKKHTTGIEKPHVVKGIKKDIARLLTTLNSNKEQVK